MPEVSVGHWGSSDIDAPVGESFDLGRRDNLRMKISEKIRRRSPGPVALVAGVGIWFDFSQHPVPGTHVSTVNMILLSAGILAVGCKKEKDSARWCVDPLHDGHP